MKEGYAEMWDRIAPDVERFVREKANRRAELTKFVLWWEENIGDAGKGRFFYWNDKKRKKYKSKEIIEHYISTVIINEAKNPWTIRKPRAL